MPIQKTSTLVNRAPVDQLARQGRRVHFLHIPKTGGTTLRYVLEGYAALNGLRSVNEARRTEPGHEDLSLGHIVMGMRPQADIFRRADTVYLTVLREPVDRMRSRVAMLARVAGIGWDEQIRRMEWEESNRVVSLLSACHPGGGDAVSRARRALEGNVHLFGFQDAFDDLMCLLAAVLEVDGIIYPKFNRTAPEHRIDTRFDEAFAEMAADDIALYRFAAELYQERFATKLVPGLVNRPDPGRRYLRVVPDEETNSVGVSLARFDSAPDAADGRPANGDPA